ncbi:MAG: metallophosphoesterase [Deltaproteobacteria bacterium]|nr:metallophosphoesterase [Deltaproteobacteria bacterium]
MRMLIFSLLLAVYVVVRFIWLLPCRGYWKVLMSAIALLAAFKSRLFSFFGGGMFFAPDLPKELLWGGSWLYAVLFIFFFLLLFADLLRLLPGLLARNSGLSRCLRTRASRINLLLLAFAAGLATLGMFNGAEPPQVREERISIAQLPPEAEGLTIAVLADLHAHRLTEGRQIAEMVRRTNILKPDIVVIVGDFVDGTVAQRGNNLLALSALSAPYGVFGVPGNHEYYSGYAEWMRLLPQLGVRMLENGHVPLFSGKIVLGGVTDTVAARFGLETPDIEKTFAGTSPETVKILLSHRPALAPEAAKHGVNLQLSGHTHGGMIRGMDLLVARFNGGFVAGRYQVGALQLYVSRGSGIWNGFPVRIGVPAEITLLSLHRKAS